MRNWLLQNDCVNIAGKSFFFNVLISNKDMIRYKEVRKEIKIGQADTQICYVLKE